MIRLSPTTIVLGRSDLKEFERRRQRRREAEMLHQEFARFVVGGPDGPAFASLQSQDAQELVASEKTQDLQTGDGQVANCEGRLLALQTSVVNTPLPIASSLEHDEYRAPSSARSSSATTNEFPAITELEDEHAYVTVGSENPARDSQWTSAPSKDDFDYGGYVEGPDERTSDNTPDRSSSFAPDDVCTPQNIRLPDTNRLRNKIPLPRSPLFLSQNTSSSPEHRPTAGLTPHVESSVAIHNTPGILFAQPARRMRPPPRTFRHQTNSFSFDSSERASAAYEQERMASTSTTDSGSRPAVDLSLHEELHGSSLQSSRATSGASHAVSEPPVEGSSAIRVSDESEQAASTLKDFLFSSPQLSLPPPFSAVSRRVSGVDILPGVEYMPRNPETSPIRSNSDTPVRNGVEGRRPTPSSSPNGFEHVSEMDSSPPFASGTSPRSLIRRAAETMVDLYRAHSPIHPSPSPSPPSTSRRGQSRLSSLELPPRTPSRTYQVYNDALPRSSQPQTPACLPEARHQSRFHPSYTAPVRRAGPRANRIDSGSREGPSLDRVQQLSTPLRRRAGRSVSPTGMMQGGYSGLYGGRENGDEEQNWAEGVRFSYAETRLWGSRDSRNDGTRLRETPEPEDWRVERIG